MNRIKKYINALIVSPPSEDGIRDLTVRKIKNTLDEFKKILKCDDIAIDELVAIRIVYNPNKNKNDNYNFGYCHLYYGKVIVTSYEEFDFGKTNVDISESDIEFAKKIIFAEDRSEGQYKKNRWWVDLQKK